MGVMTLRGLDDTSVITGGRASGHNGMDSIKLLGSSNLN